MPPWWGMQGGMQGPFASAGPWTMPPWTQTPAGQQMLQAAQKTPLKKPEGEPVLPAFLEKRFAE